MVAVPGSTMAAGDNLDALPATAWVRRENQAAKVAITPDQVSAVSFVPATTGRFTVFADVYYRGSADCHTAPGLQAVLGEEQVPLGVVDVRTDGHASVTAAPCRTSALRATVDAVLSIRVTNLASQTCSITGAPPAAMLVGRVNGTAASPTTVQLPQGYTYVQPQLSVPGATACNTPVTGEIAGSLPFTVTLAGARIAVSNDVAVSVHAVVNCYVITRPPGYLEP